MRAHIYICVYTSSSIFSARVQDLPCTRPTRTLVYPITQYPMWVVAVSGRPLPRDAQTSTRINLHRSGAFVSYLRRMEGTRARTRVDARVCAILRSFVFPDRRRRRRRERSQGDGRLRRRLRRRPRAPRFFAARRFEARGRGPGPPLIRSAKASR